VTTLMQWRAYEACKVHGLKHREAAAMFGISRSAITRRIQRYLAARNERPRPASRRRIVNVISLGRLAES
jgi:transposase